MGGETVRNQFTAWLLKPWNAFDFAIWATVFVWALVFFAPSSHAQGAGVLDPSRVPGSGGWSIAGAGTLPARATLCATVSLTGSDVMNGGAIRSALAGCTAGQAVKLPAGSWPVDYIWFGTSLSTMVSNVTLRGAGANSTFLTITAGGSCNGLGPTGICLLNASNDYAGGPDQTASWTAGYAKGTTSITLSNTTNIHNGTVLILDQLDDTFTTGDTGNIFVCQSSGASGVCSQQGGIGNGRPGVGGCSSNCRRAESTGNRNERQRIYGDYIAWSLRAKLAQWFIPWGRGGQMQFLSAVTVSKKSFHRLQQP